MAPFRCASWIYTASAWICGGICGPPWPPPCSPPRRKKNTGCRAARRIARPTILGLSGPRAWLSTAQPPLPSATGSPLPIFPAWIFRAKMSRQTCALSIPEASKPWPQICAWPPSACRNRPTGKRPGGNCFPLTGSRRLWKRGCNGLTPASTWRRRVRAAKPDPPPGTALPPAWRATAARAILQSG